MTGLYYSEEESPQGLTQFAANALNRITGNKLNVINDKTSQPQLTIKLIKFSVNG